MNYHLLIADETSDVSEILAPHLVQAHITFDAVYDGEMALKKALNQPFDAILLDILLPKMNGFDVIKQARKHIQTPILVLTARQDTVDSLLAFDLGADDFIKKPCNPLEIIARINAVIRRSQKTALEKPLFQYDDLIIDCGKRKVTLDNKPVELTNTEFTILEILSKSPNQAFSKEELTEYALGRKHTAYDRSIDVHISNLRNKVGETKNGEERIKTVRGFGYLFQPSEKDDT